VLMANLAVPLPPVRPAQLFSLAALPVLVWSRPRDWSLMERATTALLDTLSSGRYVRSEPTLA
jgi:hypothetical protein